ncbi:MAG: hypothetical protein RMM98_00995 [Acidobacteriota bacterium]|nr:hypothetical protein [Blastocatellia bacterium]MDW8238164.1 hypothetical protein [Acidobacteriota bacterium]
MKSVELLLQPVSAGDLIDRAIRLYRRHFGTLLAITALPALIAVLGGLLTVFPDDDAGLSILGSLLTYSLSPVLNLMLIGGLTKVVADHVMQQQPISFVRTWQVVLHHFGQLAGVAVTGWLLLPLTIIMVGGVGFISMTFLAGLTSLIVAPMFQGSSNLWPIGVAGGVISGIVIIIGGLLFLEVYGRVMMMPAAAVIEQQPVGSAISRGIRLGAKNALTVLAVLAFEYCLAWSIALALGVFLGVDAAIAGLSLQNMPTQTVALTFSILLQFGNIISAPVAAVAFALLYFDNRIRKEGLDVEWLAQQIPFALPSTATMTMVEEP